MLALCSALTVTVGVWKPLVAPALCGPGCGGQRADDVSLVTQDTVVVPAGGYVVIRIVSNNPGFWHMHCHMSHHLFYGMGLVLNEVSRSP